MNRFVTTTFAGTTLLIVAGAAVHAQSKAPATPDLSREWPTYGHDSGGMRFSPLTELTQMCIRDRGQFGEGGEAHAAGIVAVGGPFSG